MKADKIDIRQDTGYGLIPKSIMRSKDLSIQAKSLYAYLASFAGNTGRAFPSVGLMISELGVSRDTFYKYLNELKDIGAVEVGKEPGENGKFGKNIYYLYNTISPCPNLPDTDLPDTVNLDTISNSSKSNSSISINNLSSDNDGTPHKDIVEYLNAKTGKSFLHTAKATQRQINARLAEGFTVDDFKRVIDNKVTDWGSDNKMAEYLRPNTLFGTKFEGYLNSKTKPGSITVEESKYDWF